MSIADRRLTIASQFIAGLASLGFACAAFWELADTFGAGHFASAAAVCTAAENMWRWGIAGPVTHVLSRPPAPSEFYCHHPWGIFWVSALFMRVLGHHAWACRLPAALQSASTVPALYCAGRALWSPVAGAVTALSFAVLPIALSFADFNSLEVPVIFGVALVVWGYARYRQSYERRFAWLALGGLFYALCCDWAATVFAAVLLGAILLNVLLPARWTMPADRARLLTFWSLAISLCAIALGAHLYIFAQLGQLNELFAQANLRSSGVNLPLARVLAARKFWIEVSFTGLAIALGKLGLPVLGLRALWSRSEVELLPLAVFAMAAFQYVVFKQGADVHVFWPHYFALYFGFACGGLSQTALALFGFVAAYWPRLGKRWPGYLTLGGGTLSALLLLPDGLHALAYAHRSGGRFNENGHLIKPDKDKLAALEWLTLRMESGARVSLHPGMRQSLWVDWSLGRPVTTANHLPLAHGAARDRYYVADLRFLSAAEQDALGEHFALTAVGPFVAADCASGPSALHAFSVQRVEPTRFESYWVSSSHALRRVVPDAFLTWELRDRFGFSPNPPPTAVPKSFEELRIAHNVAVALGDSVNAERLLEALLRAVDRSRQVAFDDGATLLGTRVERGASWVVSVYVRAAGPDAAEPALLMHSAVSAAPLGSLVPKDELWAEVGMPFTIPASRWKTGYVYASVSEVIRRIGKERWSASFRPSKIIGPERAAEEFELLELD